MVVFSSDQAMVAELKRAPHTDVRAVIDPFIPSRSSASGSGNHFGCGYGRGPLPGGCRVGIPTRLGRPDAKTSRLRL